MEEVKIELPEKGISLFGSLMIPTGAQMVVAFAHGSGSGRFSPRNQQVAKFFNQKKLGTLLLDLLTEEEGEIDEVTRQFRFDIPLLATRLLYAQQWLNRFSATQTLKIGLFGSSTGAAAALIAAAKAGSAISAVVSRGGRTDLADAVLSQVRAPTLFIVGGEDYGVIELNQSSFRLLSCEKKFAMVPGATHLFEEPGALEEVSALAADWFTAQL